MVVVNLRMEKTSVTALNPIAARVQLKLYSLYIRIGVFILETLFYFVLGLGVGSEQESNPKQNSS